MIRAGTVDELIAAARASVGTLEDPAGSNRTSFAAEAGHANGYAWCLTFVVAMLKRVGVKVSPGVLETAYTPQAAYAFQHDGRWVQPEDIEIGDVVFFDFPDSKDRIQHVGIAVEAVKRSILRLGKRVVVCVEGNTSAGRAGSQDNGGGVYERTRPLAHVVGAGRPYFTTEDDDLTPEQEAKLNATHLLATAALETAKRIEAKVDALAPKPAPAKAAKKVAAK